MPITRAFLASYYDKYPFTPLSDDVSRLCLEIRSMATDLLKDSPANEGSKFSTHFYFAVMLIVRCIFNCVKKHFFFALFDSLMVFPSLPSVERTLLH